MKIFCDGCNQEHDDQNWNGKGGEWFCSKFFTPTPYEFVPDRIKDDRKKFAKDMIQPRIEGEPNPQFAKEYPQHAKKHFTDKELRKL